MSNKTTISGDHTRGGLWLGLGSAYRSDYLTRPALEQHHQALFALTQISYEWAQWAVKGYGGYTVLYDLTSPQWQAGIQLLFNMETTPEPELRIEPVQTASQTQNTIRPLEPPEPPDHSDPDQDGVLAHLDRCPTLSGESQFLGCPKDDIDGDRVDNKADYCVNTVGSVQNHGCPADELSIPPFLRKPMYFEFGRADLSTELIAHIKELSVFMSNHPNIHIHLSGHADSIGDENYNRDLSKRRVWSVYSYLTRRLGIPNHRVSYFAHSEHYPVQHLDVKLFQALSRRVTVTFIKILEQEEVNP